jgi:hypothetical protein
MSCLLNSREYVLILDRARKEEKQLLKKIHPKENNCKLPPPSLKVTRHKEELTG